MRTSRLTDLDLWKQLKAHAEKMALPENHLKHLTMAPERLAEFSIQALDMVYDFSRQRVDRQAIDLLMELAWERKVTQRFQAMTTGAVVNTTENRAALHTACRDFSKAKRVVNKIDVTAEMARVRKEIREFSEAVHAGQITGATGKPFAHVVVVGIGGSYLGTEFVARALAAYADKGICLHFLANVDIHNFGEIAEAIDPETTLWVIVSKSFTTAETMANANQAAAFMKEQGLDPARHFVSVTSKGSPGDQTGQDAPFPVLRSFHMFDFIGGRYSVTSAVGGVPLSLYLGYDRFETFLKGAHQMDVHAATAPPTTNMPLTAALLGIWNNNFLEYPAQAIIPYASPLARLAPHVQQLYMESNGKSVTAEGKPLGVRSGVIIFGEPGTNAQHSFFQLAHQGAPFPIDFIGVIKPQYDAFQALSRGVTNHQELWANLISQPRALAEGKESEDGHRSFSGNRPSSTILLEDLSPASVGKLLAFYEARTVYEAFVWGINPFDQYGVELGKKLASEIRSQMAAKNRDAGHTFENVDSISRFYLEKLMGKGNDE
ncbi:glucose-6-phosphate isomerase [Desulfosudis oleivorans]|uniref:Glucose-6-phosphate isomerase n=1 Tax=Desulfosudis oleivorans (strain DSM 6200 / JCM 39069 / Hxd3) TaxID=96561 RepID=G6PI_DESOH|nr:glucose-6-phosphate isomerase [Desulfosudis oleivorans]A8ZSB6.1 RecName: Full=Glucose-6-phosphate isomerase; Short=GPI; AltName: Full=Phosphoglucose isomerase; Short=PGI; AltName: Full=Phosphohexose isomerase; Short=PHI [Desulfosudis oleivorans Hxd3]ABW67653.1 Glucose-6-phosphate isomerase [Desulfosudis oleivorans Hxd3]